MEEVFLTKSAEETQKLGEEFARKIKNGGIVLLYGNLGAGKTTFVQGFAKGLGIQKRIISPTFIIVRTYEIPTNVIASGAKQSQEIATSQAPRDDRSYGHFYHVDLYRIENEKQIAGLGLLEIMANPDNIVVIEWPERLGSLMPKNAWQIQFERTGGEKRKITICHPE